jgi:hypothetical protein
MHIISSLMLNLLAWLNERDAATDAPHAGFDADLPPYHPLRD